MSLAKITSTLKLFKMTASKIYSAKLHMAPCIYLYVKLTSNSPSMALERMYCTESLRTLSFVLITALL